MSEQQVSHVLQNHYRITYADQVRRMGFENVISECVEKVRSMCQEQDVLTEEAQRQVNDLNARVQRGEQQVAHVFSKYEHLSQYDQLE